VEIRLHRWPCIMGEHDYRGGTGDRIEYGWSKYTFGAAWLMFLVP